jgi:catechol 2,3-dioxygenase-like lactoylglutathione lyase family enzyme
MVITYHSTGLFVQDIAASRHFYENLLGQRVIADYGPSIAFAGGLALWQAGHAYSRLFGEAYEDKSPLGRANLETYFECEDLECVWDRLTSAGVRAAHPIVEQTWGQRVMRVYDPDGHLVEIGEPLPVSAHRLLANGKTIEQISEQMSVPVDAVRVMLEGNSHS